jgi:glycosyltransferase involved in cell wall biosynthesis
MIFTANGKHMGDGKKSICIISFSPIYRDGRVLRQIRYLSVHYHLTVIGYGEPPSDWVNHENVKWYSVELANPIDHHTEPSNKRKHIGKRLISKLIHTWIGKLLIFAAKQFKLFFSYSLLGLGRFHPWFYEIWYWRKKQHKTAFEYCLQSNGDAFHANDWESLPVAAKVARVSHAKVVFDAHEYAPLELENRRYWKLLFQPAITYFIKKYSPQISASVTVAPLISERYQKEFGFDATVILNAPEKESLPVKKLNFDDIRLVYHGGAIRDRRLEKLIETLAQCDWRFSLNFILINNDPGYSQSLRKLAETLTPGRVMFYEPVPPEQVVKRISEYDIGFYLLEPNSFNNIAALPNKFFDYIVAGLALCVGPSPSMAEMVRQYGFGCVAPSFDPHHVAKTLNRLTADELSRMRSASRDAAQKINAEREMEKLVDIYDQLFDREGYCATTNDTPCQIHS